VLEEEKGWNEVPGELKQEHSAKLNKANLEFHAKAK
jgi:hypothetical protein